MKQLICLCAALLVLATACCKNEAPKDKSALEVIKARTSIRSFTGEKLTEQQIHTLLDAAMAAPTAVDLGAVWLSCYPSERIVDRIRAYLGIPADVTPLAIVPVGYPAETPSPKDKWNPDNIHYDRW